MPGLMHAESPHRQDAPVNIMMRVVVAYFLASALGLAAHVSAQDEATEPSAGERQQTSSSANLTNFETMMRVLTHKRCVNCHPNDGVPRQGEDSHPHYFGMARGADNHGFEATKCQTCHQAENNDYSGVPGTPEWSLAPHSMRWQGLSAEEIAESMLDPQRNGQRTHEQVLHHLTDHELVLWAWEPGVDAAGNPREKPPVPLDAYRKAVKQWFKDGAVIPRSEPNP